jgi:hypothetical protein
MKIISRKTFNKNKKHYMGRFSKEFTGLSGKVVDAKTFKVCENTLLLRTKYKTYNTKGKLISTESFKSWIKSPFFTSDKINFTYEDEFFLIENPTKKSGRPAKKKTAAKKKVAKKSTKKVDTKPVVKTTKTKKTANKSAVKKKRGTK